MSSVRLESIRKSFGPVSVLKGVSLDIADGEFLTIVGPSGCGKSTLLRIVAGLESQDGGSVAIDGAVVDGTRPKTRDVAMVFQSYALYPHMTVERNIAVPLLMRRLTALQQVPRLGRMLPGSRAIHAAIADEVRAVARTIGIEPLLKRKPGQISGGQRQRVALARAMVRRPKVFLMDEPLSNLDAKLRVQMRAEIRELHARLRATFIYVTHDQSEAMTMSDRVAVMMEGELIQVAAPHALYDDPDDIRIATFIGSPRINLLAGHVAENGMLRAAGAELPSHHGLPAGARPTVGVRPEAVTLRPEAAADTIAARIRLLEHLGADLLIHAQVADEKDALIARVSPLSGRRLRVGETVQLAVDPTGLLLFDAHGRRLRPHEQARSDRPATLMVS